MGRIGQAIARRAAGFRIKVLYHNRHRLDTPVEEEFRASYRSKEELLAESDFVILALPYTPGNYHLIGEKELHLIRPSAILFNIARGGLIDEPALAKALKSGQIAAAGLDVFEGEPGTEPGLIGLPNATLTPHLPGGTKEAQHGLASGAPDKIIPALALSPD